jgi:putative phage-type endonuclease
MDSLWEKTVSKKNMSHEEWLRARQEGIGGSDVPAILGISKWKTPLDVYYEKVVEPSLEEPEPSSVEGRKLRMGTAMEEIIRKEFETLTGYKVQRSNKIFKHDGHPCLLANLDGIILPSNGDDGRGVFEAKNSTQAYARHWEDDIPLDYLFQVQHYLNVTGLKWGYAAPMLDGWNLKPVRIERDEKLIKMMTDRLLGFWYDNVMLKIPPEPSTEEELKSLYPASAEDVGLIASDQLIETIEELREVRKAYEAMKTRKEELEFEIKKVMKNAEVIYDHENNVLVSWKGGKPTERFDVKKLRESEPEIYKKYCEPSATARRFLVKDVK